MIKAVIYDFDGTLANTFSVHLKAYRCALEYFKIDATDSEIVQKCFNRLYAASAQNYNISDVEIFASLYRQGVAQFLPETELYPEAKSTLEELQRRGIKIGVASLRDGKELTDALIHLELSDLLGAVVSNDQVKMHKPDPAVFIETMRKLNVQVEETIIVGDHGNDIKPAKQLGCTSALYFPEEHYDFYIFDELQQLEPDFVISNHAQLLKIIEQRNSAST